MAKSRSRSAAAEQNPLCERRLLRSARNGEQNILMAKTFYTERDIDDLKARGVDSLEVDDNIVLTDLAVERAMRLGIKIQRREQSSPQARLSPSVNLYAAYLRESPPINPADSELRQKVKAEVLRRIEGQVDEAYLDAIITRVLAGMK